MVSIDDSHEISTSLVWFLKAMAKVENVVCCVLARSKDLMHFSEMSTTIFIIVEKKGSNDWHVILSAVKSTLSFSV